MKRGTPPRREKAIKGENLDLLLNMGKNALMRKVFKTITVDNGPEFGDLSQIETWASDQDEKTGIYFAHPDQSADRAQNENLNGMFRSFFPRGKSMKGERKMRCSM